jgi:hypothetical protein
MSPLSKYKHVLGSPNEGIHSVRFMNIAIVDYIMTIILAFIISYFTSIPIAFTTIFVCVVAVLCHVLFGVETNDAKFLAKICE